MYISEGKAPYDADMLHIVPTVAYLGRFHENHNANKKAIERVHVRFCHHEYPPSLSCSV